MAYSSIMGADKAPVQPSGRSSDLLGPSDNSDSGSDASGTPESYGDSDSFGTGERGAVSGPEAKEGGDILPDRVVRLGGDEGLGDSDLSDEELTDLDGDTGAGEAGDDEA
jgi:hypothetical protein